MLTSLLLTFACAGGPVLQVHVDGEGYLRLCRDGRAVYVKSAQLSSVEGKLSDASGDFVLPTIAVPADAASLESDLEGNIFATRAGIKAKIGQFVIAAFSAAASLQDKDGVLIASEKPSLGNPGDGIFGVIRADAVTGPSVKPAPAPAATIAPKTVVSAESVTQQHVVPPKIEKQIEAKANAHNNSGDQRTPMLPPVQISTQRPTSPSIINNRSGVSITVAPETAVGTENITLGQVATIDADAATKAQLENVELGNAPATGVKRFIDRQRVISRLKAAGFKTENLVVVVPPNAFVRRQGQQITNSQFVMVAVQSLIMTGNVQSGTWECTDIFPDFEAPGGKVDLKTESMSGVDTGSASVTVGIFVEGKRVNSRTLHLTLKTAIPPVRAGMPVKVIMIAGRAQVDVPGIVITGGKVGESITVQVRIGTPEVKTIHVGRLVGVGVIEVKL